MEKFAKFKHEYVDYLYNGHIYWRSERKIFDEQQYLHFFLNEFIVPTKKKNKTGFTMSLNT